MSDPFTVGRHYRVKASFDALRDRFEAGEVLIYDHSAWSRYDGITGYIFSRVGQSGTRCLDIYDHEASSPWTDRFEALDTP